MSKNNNDDSILDEFLGVVLGVGTAYVTAKYGSDTSSTTTVPGGAGADQGSLQSPEGSISMNLTPLQMGGFAIAGLLAVLLIVRLTR